MYKLAPSSLQTPGTTHTPIHLPVSASRPTFTSLRGPARHHAALRLPADTLGSLYTRAEWPRPYVTLLPRRDLAASTLSHRRRRGREGLRLRGGRKFLHYQAVEERRRGGEGFVQLRGKEGKVSVRGLCHIHLSWWFVVCWGRFHNLQLQWEGGIDSIQ